MASLGGSVGSVGKRNSSDQVSFASVRQRLAERAGVNGARHAYQALEGLTSHEDFRQRLAQLGVRMADEDFELMCQYTPVGELQAKAVGSLSSRRFLIVREAFRRVLRDSGCAGGDTSQPVPLRTLLQFYDPSRFNEVQTRLRTIDECLEAFNDAFNEHTNPSGEVTLAEFQAYYCGVSQGVRDDLEFERLVLRTWNLDKPHTAPREELAATATRIPASTEGREHPLYQPSSSAIGKDLSRAFTVEKKHNHVGAFTKNAPPMSPSSGLNTATNRSVV